MEELEKGMAELVAWRSPEGQAVSLRPKPEGGGRLEVRIHGNAVTVRGKDCVYTWTDPKTGQKGGDKLIEDLRITVPLQNSVIHWRFIDANGMHS